MEKNVVRGVLGLAAAAFMLIAGCADEEESSSRQASTTVVNNVDDCDLSPIPATGTLRACAAGTSRVEGPGVPYNFKGAVKPSLPMSAARLAALAAATALANARNPATQDPIDRGFPPPRVLATDAKVAQ